MHPHARVSIAVLAAAVFLLHGRALAGNDSAAAEALFLEGKRLVAANDFKQACPKFEESYRLDPTPGTMLNLADCDEKAGKFARAWEHWREALARLPADDPRREFATERATAIELRVPRLTLRTAPSFPKDATVERDGTRLQTPSLGVALPVDPGAHRIVVRAPGRDDRVIEVSLAESERKEIELDVGPPSGLTGLQIAGIIAGGVGVAGFVAGGVAGGLVLDKHDQVERECPDSRCQTQAGFEAAQSGKTLLLVNAVAWGAGAAALGAGAAMFLLGGPKAPAQKGYLAPMVGPGVAGIVAGGRF